MRRPLLAFAVALVLAGCGGGETVIEGRVPQETTPTIELGDAAGREVFISVAQPPCGNCHTYEAAGTEQTLGPNLDESLQGKDAAYILEQIVNPDSQVDAFADRHLMPEDYGEKLTDKQLADLVAFLLPRS